MRYAKDRLPAKTLVAGVDDAFLALREDRLPAKTLVAPQA